MKPKGLAWLSIVLIVVVGILIGGGIYWYQQSLETPQPVSLPQTYQQTSTTAVSQASTNKTSVQTSAQSISVPGMSEYTDSNFGFSFWYPSSWSVKTGEDEIF